MRAEIRAIQKVGLAKAVYDQKLEEQRRLCDMILDASVRLGEMTKAIPKADADRRSEKYQNDSAVGLVKTKTETVRDLGFSSKQVERFETLADNRDLVELEKAQAREEGRMTGCPPSRSCQAASSEAFWGLPPEGALFPLTNHPLASLSPLSARFCGFCPPARITRADCIHALAVVFSRARGSLPLMRIRFVDICKIKVNDTRTK